MATQLGFIKIQRPADELSQVLSESNHDLDPNRSLSYAIDLATEEFKVRRGLQVQLHAPGDELDKIKHSQKDDDLYRILGKNGLDLTRALIIQKYADQIPGSDLYARTYFDNLRKNPKEGTQMIQQALGTIPSQGYPNERTILLSELAGIPGASNEAKTASLTELTRNPMPARPDPETAQTEEELNVALSVTSEVILYSTAYSIYLNNTHDANEALDGTVNGLVSQQDAGIRKSIISQFVTNFPKMRGQLQEALAAHQVSVSPASFPGGTVANE